jgi:hypothetical protein
MRGAIRTSVGAPVHRVPPIPEAFRQPSFVYDRNVLIWGIIEGLDDAILHKNRNNERR